MVPMGTERLSWSTAVWAENRFETPSRISASLMVLRGGVAARRWAWRSVAGAARGEGYADVGRVDSTALANGRSCTASGAIRGANGGMRCRIAHEDHAARIAWEGKGVANPPAGRGT